MLYRLISYARFLSKSTNHHGVHSPFVYDFVTTVFYNKKKLKTNSISKKTALFERLFNHFDIKNITIYGNPSSFQPQHLSTWHIDTIPPQQENKTVDCVFISKNHNSSFKTSEALFRKLHNNSLLIVEGCHTSEERSKYWHQLAHHENATAVIDSFSYGFIFIRKEQKKQTFNIRL